MSTIIANYPHQQQYLEEWCWAAVASSVSERYNASTPWTQNALAAKFVDTSCQVVTFLNAPAPQVCHAGRNFITVLSDPALNNYAWQADTLSFDQIQSQINAQWPLCCIIYWGALSHVVTIVGYSDNSLLISDPQCLGIFPIDYNEFLTTYRDGTWKTTIGTKPSNVI